jgi:alpha-galactosidase
VILFLSFSLPAGTFSNTSKAYALENGLGKTPPMGWNSWNKFGCNINEQLILDTAKSMIKSGMKDAGYQYVNIDDCWMSNKRDADGNYVPDPVRFPHGIKWLADQIHEMGLKTAFIPQTEQ